MGAAMELFASSGYRGTTIGDIEAAVGLVPRRGALYRHFESKEALLIAVVEEYSVDVASFGAAVEVMSIDNVAAVLGMAIEGVLELLDQQRPLFRILQRDFGELPESVAATVHARLVASGYVFATRLFERLLDASGQPTDSARPIASIALGAAVHFCEDEILYGVTPAGVTRGEFVDAWVELLRGRLTVGANVRSTQRIAPR